MKGLGDKHGEFDDLAAILKTYESSASGVRLPSRRRGLSIAGVKSK
jgi:hypothetical protein